MFGTIFFYIIQNEDFKDDRNKYYKYGITNKIENRLNDYHTYSPNRFEYIKVYKLNVVNSKFKVVDNIFSKWCKDINKLHKLELNFSNSIVFEKLNNYLLDKGGGVEFVYEEGLQYIYKIINNEFDKFGIEIVEEYDENKIENLNNSHIQYIKKKKQTDDDKYFDGFKELFKMDKPKPNDLQKEVLERNYFNYNNIGKLIWCCGLGKTLMSIFFCLHYNFKNIVIGVPSLYLLTQFYEDVIKFYNIDSILKIGSLNDENSTTNKKQIKTFLQKDSEFKIILVTYTSCYKVKNISDKLNFKFDFKIADECHHLVAKNLNQDKKYVNFHSINSKKSLYMTATEKIIEDFGNFKGYTMEDENIFGSIIDKKSISWAIENKKITDYNILIIKNDLSELNEIIDSLDLFIKFKNKYELLFSAYCALKSINDKTSRHLLVYTNSCSSALIVNKMIDILLDSKIFNSIDKNQLYNESLYSDNHLEHTIETKEYCKYCIKNKCNVQNEKHNCKNNPNDCRFKCKKKLNIFHKENEKEDCEICKFKKSKYGIISCVYIFSEGFNLNILDSVVFGENMGSEIRIFQSALRPNRLNYKIPDKIANIIIPYNSEFKEDNNKLDTIISQMSENDSFIEQKIKLIHVNEHKSNKKTHLDNKIKLKNNDELKKIIFDLYNRQSFARRKTEVEIYNCFKDYNKGKFTSVREYKRNIQLHLNKTPRFNSKIWKGWYDFLNIDINKYPRSKSKWITYCKTLNIDSLEKYIELSKKDEKLIDERELEHLYYNEDFNFFKDLNIHDDLSYMFE